MAERTLRDRRILVVEDEYLIAADLRNDLRDEDANVLGPIASVEKALDFIRREKSVDAVILDINLGGEPAYAVADLLMERGIPFVFTTGYDATSIPLRYSHIAHCEKPLNMTKVLRAIGLVISE